MWMAVTEAIRPPLDRVIRVDSGAVLAVAAGLAILVSQAFVRACTKCVAMAIKVRFKNYLEGVLERDGRQLVCALSSGLLGLLLAAAEALRSLPSELLCPVGVNLHRVQSSIPEFTFEEVLVGLGLMNMLAVEIGVVERLGRVGRNHANRRGARDAQKPEAAASQDTSDNRQSTRSAEPAALETTARGQDGSGERHSKAGAESEAGDSP